MFGRGNITTEKITLSSTLQEILLFPAVYAICGIGQIFVVLAAAVLIGKMAGLIFLFCAGLLSFQLRGTLAVNPLQVGIVLQQKHEVREYVKVAQFLLVAIGFLGVALRVSGYFPDIWQWRITWDGSRYVILSRWFNGQWYYARPFEIAGRAIGLLSVPFIGWPTLTMVKWAARMELYRPKQREAQVTPVSAENTRGPFGEVYVSGKPQQAEPTIQNDPEIYVTMVEE